jgi:hypothetical protein
LPPFRRPAWQRSSDGTADKHCDSIAKVELRDMAPPEAEVALFHWRQLCPWRLPLRLFQRCRALPTLSRHSRTPRPRFPL